jgi:protein arginine kinase activator
MAENLKCSHCNNPATVHLTQIVNNKIIKVDLCEACAQAQGVTDPAGFSLADMLSKSELSPAKGEPQVTCPSCGLTSVEFRRSGRLGCASCFEAFGALIRPALEDMHAGTVHKGKTPHIALSRQNRQAELHGLENALQRAIAEEAYEDAAKYRDQIHALTQAVEAEAMQ